MGHIQAVALRLFEEQGYRATTIEQIADAAAVAPSSIYRYFGTKEQLVLREEADEWITTSLAERLRTHAPIAAVRDALAAFDAEGMAGGDGSRRLALILADPELANAMVVATHAIGLKIGLSIADARAVPARDGAAQGVAIAAALHSAVVNWHEAGAGSDLMDRLLGSLSALADLA